MKVRVNSLYRYRAGEVGEVIGYNKGDVIVAFKGTVHIDVWSYDTEDLTQVDDEPTDEQIDRFLKLYCEYCCCPSADLKIYPTVKDYIKAKWNEDKAKID